MRGRAAKALPGPVARGACDLWSFYISERVDRSKSTEMREFSGVTGLDALYQGTTSVVPLKVNKDMGFTGCGKRSNRERNPSPQRLKPNRFAITYGRPEGRPLRRIRFFRSLFSPCAFFSAK